MSTFSTEALLPIASRLAGETVSELTAAASGGNSRIYRAETKDKTYALKYYAPSPPGTRNRLVCETAALRFFAAHCVPHVPMVYGSEDRFALYDWVEGSIPATITETDVDAAAGFLAHFAPLSQTEEAPSFGTAAEACLCLSELLAQISRRLARLREVAPSEPALYQFLENDLLPKLAAAIADAEATWQARGWDPAREIPPAERRLIPGDFGFHNCLKQADGTLTFIDFEYFGWDDPVKLVADTLLHPGYQLAGPVLKHLHNRLAGLFGTEAFTVRLRALAPLFSLRWALILCNEFLEEKRVNRAFAADIAPSDAAEWSRRKQVQLAKAHAMLAHPALAAINEAK